MSLNIVVSNMSLTLVTAPVKFTRMIYMLHMEYSMCPCGDYDNAYTVSDDEDQYRNGTCRLSIEEGCQNRESIIFDFYNILRICYVIECLDFR